MYLIIQIMLKSFTGTLQPDITFVKSPCQTSRPLHEYGKIVSPIFPDVIHMSNIHGSFSVYPKCNGNFLRKVLLMSTQNICFNEEIRKISI